MANKQQFTLQFNADTTQAKKAINDLLKSLNNVSKVNLDSLGLTEEIRQASEAADELKLHLQAATNATTGKLNLIDFNNSIQASGQSVAQLMTTLANGGQVGQQAFQQMATAIANTQVPLKQTNTMLNNMMTTLKNTVKWELSSNVVHGLESALSNAVSYVQNLNTSLTNIRIVTGQSAADMTKFASAANEAARNLSTTTKAYADAALIYYQQGDSDDLVAKKAALTIKAANTSFSSTAEEMSEYLTAVWNSYQAGADELESYIDIMASLGAETATSLEEIATAMQKVAATANTVGVSMEQMSSIIATVSSVTREAPESIGTSFKTILARMGDLKLGKTLEDGVSLGTVSSTLNSIGVSILNANGEMREMGDIITDLGNKWQTLTNAETVAIAQVVGGKRQYTQLMALFENWDKYKENLTIAFDSDGALEQMSDIYDESVKAAQNRATAALEALYSSLLNDKMLIQFSEAITTITDNITNMVDALGGLGGVATTVGGILLKTFSSKVGASIKTMGQNITNLFTGQNAKDKYISVLQNTASELANSRSVQDQATLRETQNLLDLKTKLLTIEDSLTDKQAQAAQAALSGLSEQIAQLNELEQTYERAEQSVSRTASTMQRLASVQMQTGQGKNFEQIFSSYINGNNGQIQDTPDSFYGVLTKKFANFQSGSTMTTALSSLSKLNDINSVGTSALGQSFSFDPQSTTQLQTMLGLLKQIQSVTQDTGFAKLFTQFNEEILKSEQGLQQFKQAIQEMTSESTTEFQFLEQKLRDAFQQIKDPQLKEQLSSLFNRFLDQADGAADALLRFGFQEDNVANKSKKLQQQLDSINTKFTKVSQGISTAISSMIQMVSGMQMLNSASQNLASGGSFLDNILPILMGVASILPTIISLIGKVTTAIAAAGTVFSATGIGAILLAIAAIGSTIWSIIKGINDGKEQKKQEELTTKAEKANTKMSEDAQEIDDKRKLISNYNNLYETYMKTGEGQDQLRESAYALAEAYGLVGANVLIAEGNFEQFNAMLSKELNFDTQIENAEAAYKANLNQLEGQSVNKTHKSSLVGETLSPSEVIIDQYEQQGVGVIPVLYTSGALQYADKKIFHSNSDRSYQIDGEELFNSLSNTFGESIAQEYLKKMLDLEGLTIDSSLLSDAQGWSDFFKEKKFKYDSPIVKSLSSNWDNGEEDPVYQFLHNDLNQKIENSLSASAQEWQNLLNLPSDIDLSEFFDVTGTFQWNSLSDEAKLDQFYKIKEVNPRIQEHINFLSQEQQKYNEDSKEYQDLQTQIEGLSSIVSIFDQVVGENSDIAKTVDSIENSANSVSKYRLMQEQLQNFIGRYEDKDNTTLTDFNSMVKALSENIDVNIDDYPDLKEIMDKYGEDSVQYKAAKQELIDSFIKDYTAFDQYILIYDDIVAKWSDTDKQNKAFEALEKLDIMDSSQVTSNLLNAIDYAMNDDTFKGNLWEHSIVSAANKANIDANKAKDSQAKATEFKNLAEKGAENLDIDSATELYTSYMEILNSKTIEDIASWEEFVEMDYDQRTAYLDHIAKIYQDTAEEDIKTAKASAEASAQTWKDVMNNDRFSNIEEEQARYYQQAYNQTLLQYREATDENGDSFYYKISDGQEGQHYTLDDIWGIATDNDSIYTYDIVDDYLFAANSYNNMMGIANGYESQLAAQQLLDGGETISEIISRTSGALTELNQSASDFAKNGQLSAKAMLELKKNGINPSDIKNAKDYLQQMQKIQGERINSVQSMKDNYKTTYSADFDVNKIWGAEEIASNAEEYAAWQEIYNAYIAAQESQDTIYATAITLGENSLTKMTEDLVEAATNYENAANILANSIIADDLNFENLEKLKQAGFDISQEWDSAATNADRAKIAAQQYVNAIEQQAQQRTIISTQYEAAAEALNENLSASIFSHEFDEQNEKHLKDQILKLDDNFQQSAWLNALNSAKEKGLLANVQSYSEAIGIIKQELKETGELSVEEIDLQMAKLKDSLVSIYTTLGEQEAALAESVVKNWEDAFTKIANLRKSILMGEDISTILFSSFSDYMTYRSAYEKGNLANAYMQGTVSDDDFIFNNYADDTWKQAKWQAMGEDYFKRQDQMVGPNGEVSLTGSFYTLKSVDELASQLGITDTNPDTKKSSVWEEIKPKLENFLTESGKTTDEISKTLEVWEKSFKEGGTIDVTTLYTDMEAGLKEFQKAMQANSEFSLAKAAYEAEVKDLQDTRDTAKQYAAVTDTISKLENRNSDTIQAALSAASIDQRAYLEYLGVNNLDELANWTSEDWDNTTSQLQKDAEAAGQDIVAAGQMFMAIVTGQGWDGKTPLVLGDYSTDETLKYGVDSYVGKYVQELIDSTTQTQNNLTGGYDASAYTTTMNDHATNAGFSSADDFMSYAYALNESLDAQNQFNTNTSEGREQLYKFAEAVAKAEDGFSSLESMTEDTWKTLKESSKKGTKEWNTAMQSIRKTISKIFTTDLANISQDFIDNHLDDIEKMADGDIEAAERVERALLETILGDELSNKTIEIDIDADGVVDELSTVADLLNSFGDEFADQDIGFSITADESPALQALNNIMQVSAEAGNDISENIQAALNAIGWEPELEYQVMDAQGTMIGHTTSSLRVGNQYVTASGETTTMTEGMYVIPVIKGTKKTGGGASSLKKPTTSSGGGGGGGEAKKLDKKDPNDEKKRYFQIDNALDTMKDALEMVDKLKTRAFGAAHLKNLDSEISLLKQEVGLQEEYINQAKEWLAVDKERVASLGATFDGEGNISNYDSLMDSILDKYNSFIDKYNAASSSEQENMEDEKEEMDEWYEDAIDWIDQYQETLSLIREKENEILELQNKISAQTLEKIQYKVEYKVDLNDAEQDYLDYINDRYEDILDKQDVLLDNYIREGQLAEQNLSYLATARQELEAAYATGDLTQADYVEGLQDIQEQTLENLETIQDVREEIEELYKDTLKLADEALEEQTKKIDNAAEAMESYISIMQLMGKGQTYKEQLYFYEKQYEYNLASLEAQKSYLDVLKEQEQYYLDRLNATGTLSETERAQYEALQATMQEVQSDVLSSTKETLETLQEMYNTTIEDIMKDLEDSIAGAGNDLAWLTEEYGYYTDELEEYVSASRELYEVSKLNRNIESSINNTTSSVHKKQLKELQDKINKQSELNDLSQYQIDMMNLEYELLLKQIALEEAQNAKNTVRLTRDSEGNMVYQYTANADEITKAQQEYEDVLQQMADKAYEQESNIYNLTLQLRTETLNAIKEIAQDETLTEEQKQARIAEVLEHYYEKARYLQEQYNIVSEDNMMINQLVSERYNTSIEELTKRTQSEITDTIAEMINDTDNYRTEMENAYEQIKSAMDEYQEKIDEVADAAGVDYKTITENAEALNKVTEDATIQTDELTKTLKLELVEINTTTTAWDNYTKKLQTVVDTYKSMYEAIQKAITAQSTLANATAPSSISVNTDGTKYSASDSTNTQNQGSSSGSGGSGSNGTGSGTSSSSNILYISYSTLVTAGPSKGGSGGGKPKGPSSLKVGSTGSLSYNPNEGFVGAGWSVSDSSLVTISGGVITAKAAGSVTITVKYWDRTNQQETSNSTTSGSSTSGLISKPSAQFSYTAFATGGLADFTGPAWLDGTASKPELVLNQDDTENILQVVDTLHQLDKNTLSLINDYVDLATSSMVSNLLDIHATMPASSKAEELLQNVQITAEFPNVQDSNEIQDAFDNLINRAAQYMGSKR